jgi:hypothetical protein
MCREWKDTRDMRTEYKLATRRYESTHKHCNLFKRNSEHLTSASEIAERMWPERDDALKPGVEKYFRAANTNNWGDIPQHIRQRRGSVLTAK